MAAGRSLCSPFLSVSSESVTGSQPGGVGPSYLLDALHKTLRALEADSCLLNPWPFCLGQERREQTLHDMGDVVPLIPMWFWSNNHRRKEQGDK